MADSTKPGMGASARRGRSAGLLLAAALTLAAGASHNAAAAPTDTVFTVANYPVEARADNAAAAKDRALAEGQQSAAFGWLQTTGFSYGPESGTGQVTVRTSVTGPAKFARIDVRRGQSHCEDQVRIPVSVVLATAGGALDESLTVDLIATTADEAAVTALVPSAELKGAFAFVPDTLSGRRFGRLEVNLRFLSAGSAGYLLAGIESGDAAGGSVSFQALPLACWGDIPSSFFSACGD